MFHLRSAIPLVFITALACTDKDVEIGGTGPESDRSDELYERSRLLQVHVDIDPTDWDVLRFQDRGDLYFTDECDWPESPFTWFTATVTVDGETFENVGIRKKGFVGSMDDEKPSLKIRFDKFVEGQTFLDVKRLTLNNSRQDESYVRQCLAYDLFRAAGTPAARCNFAEVFINEEPAGIFVNVESMKKPFIRRHFEDEDGYFYEGTLSDFREGWRGTFEQKTNEDEPSTRAIDAIATALEATDDTLIEELSSVLDLDAFLTFWAVETMTAHWDGYAGNTNNYYFYEDPTSDLIHFIPWGTDGTFMGPYMLFEDRMAPRSINAAGLITRRLYMNPEGQAMYIDRLKSLLDAHWDVDALEQTVIDMAEVIGPSLPEDEADDVREEMHDTVDYIAEHGELIRAEIDNGPKEWDVALRDSLCEQWAGSDGSTGWEATITFGEDRGYLEYWRDEEDSPGCALTADLIDLISIEDCGEDCNFAMGVTIANVQIEDEEESGCDVTETGIAGAFFAFGESTSIIYEDEDFVLHGLLTYERDQWSDVPNGYSYSPDDTIWVFGQES